MIPTPHDRFFKAAFSKPHNAAPVLRSVLPPRLAKLLDFSTLRPQRGTFVDNKLRARFSDLLFRVRFAGRRAFLYLL